MEAVVGACRWIADRPIMEQFRTRWRRRALVGATLVVIAAMPSLGALSGSDLVVLVVLVPFMLLVGLLAGSTRFLADIPSGRLDEWHRRQRESGYTGAYWLGSTLGLGGGLAVAAVIGGDVSEGLRGGTILAVAVLVALLPTLVIAWRLPDEVSDADPVADGR